MATIQDIFDWLNQGAQGDIPGTGGEQPNAPAASQPTPAAAIPSQASPQDYTGGLSPGMLTQYNALVQAGVPPGLAHMILTSDQQQPQGEQPQQGQQGQKSQTGEQKKEGGLQGSPGYQAGHEAGMGLDQLFFGKPQQQQSQQGQQQAQTQPGLFDWLGSWFNSPQQSSDWNQ